MLTSARGRTLAEGKTVKFWKEWLPEIFFDYSTSIIQSTTVYSKKIFRWYRRWTCNTF